MKKIWYLLVLIQLLFILPVFAQQNKPANSVSVSNAKYVIHKIEKGETIFSICKKYNCDEKELKAANPQLINGLKTGESLNIPVTTADKSPKTAEKNKDEFVNHIVKKGETLYSISKQYNVPIETIRKHNPEIKQDVKLNQTIRILNLQAKNKVETQSPVKKEKVEKVDYTLHEIEQGETFYSLQRRYGVTKDQLLELNPALQNGLKVGDSIKMPSDKTKNEDQVIDKNAYIEHSVEPGETEFSICAKFNIKIDELKELNPDLKERGLISGETIYIPKNGNGVAVEKTSIKSHSKEESESESKVAYKSNRKKEALNLSNDTFRITMFLPLFLSHNESINSTAVNQDDKIGTDSTETTGTDKNQVVVNNISGRSLYDHSRNFLSFYEGFLIALDTMKKSGTNIRLDLYDNQFSQTIVDSVIHHTDLVNSDLIIGPVDVKLQKAISNFSNKNQIPLVSPFSSDDDYALTNSFYFQINPTKDFVLRKTAEFIGKEYCNKNVIILTPGSYEQLKGTDLVETIRDRIKYYASKKNVNQNNFTKIDINEDGNQGYWLLKKSLKPDMENIVFIPPSNNRTEREAILSKAINSLYVLSEEFHITLVGMSDYTSFKSINTAYFHKLNLHFVTPNFIDYQNPEVRLFIKNYRAKFLTEPNPFSYRGYDIAKFFISAYLQNGRNFTNKISSVSTNTLQGMFKPKRIKEFSGFINKTLYVVDYSPEFEVKVESLISE